MPAEHTADRWGGPEYRDRAWWWWWESVTGIDTGTWLTSITTAVGWCDTPVWEVCMNAAGWWEWLRAYPSWFQTGPHSRKRDRLIGGLKFKLNTIQWFKWSKFQTWINHWYWHCDSTYMFRLWSSGLERRIVEDRQPTFWRNLLLPLQGLHDSKQQVPPKRCYLHVYSATTQNTVMWKITTVRTWKPV